MYLGIDVHKQYSQVAVMDESGEIVEEVRVENANLDDLAQQYTGAKAAIEATSNYYHIHDTLSEYLDVTVAHPGKLTLIAILTARDIDIFRVDRFPLMLSEFPSGGYRSHRSTCFQVPI